MTTILALIAGLSLLAAATLITLRMVAIWPLLNRRERPVALLCHALILAMSGGFLWAAWSLG